MSDNRSGDWVLAGRIWYNTKTGQSMRLIQGGALPATEAFTGTDGSELSASWTYNTDGSFFGIYSNSLRCENNAYTIAHHNVETYNNDQYATATMVAVSTNADMGVAVRCSPTANTKTGYFFACGSSASYLEKAVADSYSQLGSSGAEFAVNDVIRVEVSGTTLTGKKNGTTVNPPGAQTDSSIASGKAGVAAWGNANDCRLDNWEGGNLSTGATDNQSSYLKGKSTSTDSQLSYLYGNITVVDSQPTYLRGYLEGQYLRPDSDISRSGLWQNETSGSVLYSSIDETSPSDSDYAKIDTTGSGAYFEVGLTNAGGSPASSKDHVVRWRGAISSGSDAVSVRVELRQGSTTVAYRDQALTTSYRTYAFTLTSGEIAVITDYSDLRMRVTVL